MESAWIKLTFQDGDQSAHVNFSNVNMVEKHKKGARLWFLAGDKENSIDVTETPEEVMQKLDERRQALRSEERA